MVTGLYCGGDKLNHSTQEGATIYNNLTDTQSSGTSNTTSTVQFIPRQCNKCLL